MSSWKQLRVLLLLLLLGAVALNEYLRKARSMDWSRPMLVVIYPINADGDSRTQQYIDALNQQSFVDIREYFKAESLRYGQPVDRYFHIDVADDLVQAPPLPPRGAAVSRLDVVLWSLQFRWFAWQQNNYVGGDPDIQLFVSYYHPDNVNAVPHSLGLQKGMIGAVHAYAHKKQQAQNQVVIAHEMLHTLGASDKYDASNNEPLFPIGYARPNKKPLLPQTHAEIMAGRIPVQNARAKMPKSLKQTRIGAATALEVGLQKEVAYP